MFSGGDVVMVLHQIKVWSILDIIEENDGTVKCIIVKFDSDKVGAQQRKTHHHIAEKYKDNNGTPIFRKKITYHLFYIIY